MSGAAGLLTAGRRPEPAPPLPPAPSAAPSAEGLAGLAGFFFSEEAPKTSLASFATFSLSAAA